MTLSFLPRAWTCLRCQTKQFLPLPRPFTSSAITSIKHLPPRRQINEADITEVFLCGSGPGGQKINKTASAVQLKHLPTGLVVKCQATRSRDQNRKTARKILAEKLEVMELGDGSRVMMKAAEAARKKASKRKKAGRKYRKVEEEKEGEESEVGVVSEEDGFGDGRAAESRAEGDVTLGRSNKVDPP